ncbi:MAG: hypothetical protein CME06_12565 [Gemmatimonadetes bacterium]|nr:hypothetical protein [Gemmatimonadota bacterium]
MIRSASVAATLIAGLAGVAGADAVEGAGTQGYAWVTNIEGTRAAGMGGAMTAAADPLDAPFFNPAALGNAGLPEFEIGYRTTFSGAKSAHLSAVQPMGAGGIGYSIAATSYGALDEVNDTGVPTNRTFTPYTIAGGFSYAIPSGPWMFGGTTRVLTQSIHENRSTALALDLGAIWTSAPLAVGAAIRHLGIELDPLVEEKEALPLTGSIGAMWSEDELSLAADLEYSESAGLLLHAGGEYIYQETLALLLGYGSVGRDQAFDPSILDGLSIGAAVLLARGMTFRYAATFQGDLGVGHRASMGYSFR